MRSRLRVILALAPLWALACGSRSIATTGDEATSSDSESGTTASDPGPDLPPGPECPAKLGSLVECECGTFVDTCALESADGDSCNVACERTQTCDTVICEFDWAHGGPVCVELVNPDALDCTFNALLSGEPVEVLLVLHNTYDFATWNDYRSFTRLDVGHVLALRDRLAAYDVGEPEIDEWGARILAITEAELQACSAADFDEARFECLSSLWWSASVCADPSDFSCVP